MIYCGEEADFFLYLSNMRRRIMRAMSVMRLRGVIVLVYLLRGGSGKKRETQNRKEKIVDRETKKNN